jgi:hypothetical protein
MKFLSTVILFAALLAGFAVSTRAEETGDPLPLVETLRLQLLDVEGKEAELQSRAKQLDEDLKPENIERVLAGIGSTTPEELRELRRRQISIERDGVRAQLRLLATSRERLESVIRTTESQAYQKSAEGMVPPLNQMFAAPKMFDRMWRVAIIGGLIAIVVIVVGASIARRVYVFAKYSGPRSIMPTRHKNYAR